MRHIHSHRHLLLAAAVALLALSLLATSASAGSSTPAAPPSPALLATERLLSLARPQNTAELLSFLRYPSISADPTRAASTAAAASWLADRLVRAGLRNVAVLQTTPSGAAPPLEDAHLSPDTELFHPAVYGDWLSAADPAAPTLLIYGHYDVQPSTPDDEWTSPPFEPEIRHARVYARGASDDKGHIHVPIAAVEAWLSANNGSLPVNVKFLIEGEEEVGSPHLLPLLQKHKHLLQADYVFSADGGQVGPDTGGLCLGLRGSVALQVDVHGADSDSHSGTFGGGVHNPAQALSHILASLRHVEDGRALVPGFYDDVVDLTSEERADFAAYEEVKPVSETLASIGAKGGNSGFGERGYSFYERTWARPTLDIVGMWAGYTGPGIKTVLPASAHAKLSARLVEGQTPDVAADQIQRHVKVVAQGLGDGVEVTVTRLAFTAAPYVAHKGGVANRVAARVLGGLYPGGEKKLVYFRMGGSIPVTAMFKDVLGVETVMFAFGGGDNVHAPDEFAPLADFEKGEIGYARLLEVVAYEHRVAGPGAPEVDSAIQEEL
jgi:acetylornithine deacetylase/succinyl-diaminopimelate desuccinylase-like protein